VQHVEKEKNSLEDKKNIALDYIRTENDIALQKCALFQLHIADSDGNIRVTSEMVVRSSGDKLPTSDGH
jgi:structural maintenance of chromosome 4